MRTRAAEVAIDDELVARLLQDQLPDLAGRQIRHAGSGWDNELFRLGDDLAVRLPRRALAAPLIENEQRWLRELAPRLPLPVPIPVRIGAPGCGYRWPWSVVPWLDGDTAEHMPPEDLFTTAETLGAFCAAMHRPAPTEAPRNPTRGTPLAARDELLGDALATLDDDFDVTRLRRCWEQALNAPAWQHEPVWLHGDIHPLNLLVDRGRLSAIIDFGDLCAGDPASDFAVAWMLFDENSRDRFRTCAGAERAIDDATWRRAWGWALCIGVSFANGDDRMRTIGLRTLQAALADDPDRH